MREWAKDKNGMEIKPGDKVMFSGSMCHVISRHFDDHVTNGISASFTILEIGEDESMNMLIIGGESLEVQP